MIRSEYYRRYVAALPCIHCGLEGYSQAAHANNSIFGKGMGQKAHDCTDAYRHEMQLQERCDRKTWWGFSAKTRRGDACTTN